MESGYTDVCYAGRGDSMCLKYSTRLFGYRKISRAC